MLTHGYTHGYTHGVYPRVYPWVYPWVHIFEVPWPPSGPPENTAPSKLWARARSRNAFHARDGRRSRGTLCGGMILCRIVWMCVGSLKDLSAIIATQCCKHGSRNMNRYQNTARATCLRYRGQEFTRFRTSQISISSVLL